MSSDPFTTATDLDVPSWAPSPALRRTLGRASWATLAAGVVLLAQAAAGLLLPPETAALVAHGLGWLALVPLLWVVVGYVQLGQETDCGSLLRSSVCLYAALVLGQMFDLAALDGLPWVVQLVLWIVCLVGLVVLAILPFGIQQGLGDTPEIRARRAADGAACRAASTALKAGQRVLADWHKSGSWYAGVVRAIEREQFHVTYDDTDAESVGGDRIVAEQLTPASSLTVGTRVLARWWNGSTYYAAVVTALRPGEAHLRYDDDDTEWHRHDAVPLPVAAATVAAVVPAEPAPERVAEEKASSGGLAGKLAGIFGAVGGSLLLIRLGGAGLRVLMRRGAGALPAAMPWTDIAAAVLLVIFLVLLAIYAVWFAAAKIAARSRLGAAGVLLGVAELLGLAAGAGMIGWVAFELIGGDMQGLPADELAQLEAQLSATLVPYLLGWVLAWTTLTLWFFASLRGRHTPASDEVMGAR